MEAQVMLHKSDNITCSQYYSVWYFLGECLLSREQGAGEGSQGKTAGWSSVPAALCV